MLGIDRRGLKGAFIAALSTDEVERIHRGALQVLEHTGLTVHDNSVLTLLHTAGCRVDRNQRHAWLSAAVVEQATAQAPSIVTIYNRLGEPAMKLGTGPLFARTSSGATGVLDMETGRRREPTSQDAAAAVRLADALPHLHGVSAMAVQPADVPVSVVDVYAMRTALTNTSKPLGYVCLNEPLVERVIAMAAAVVGGEETLRQRPILTALAESTSPLQLVASQLAVVQAFASRGLPLTIHAHPMAGLTAPVTLAGELVVTHAEILALVAVAQLIRPGTPVVYGMSSSVPDMRRGINLSGAVEIGLLGAAVACLARRCGLPCLVSTGTDAHRPGAQSVMERMLTLMPPALAGVDLVNLTTLDTKMMFSPEQVVIDETVLCQLERLLRGIDCDDHDLALELIHQVGSGGDYLTSEHTLRHHRSELLLPPLVSRELRDEWEAAGAPGMRSQARERVRDILAEHRPVPLPPGVPEQLDEIVSAAATINPL